MVSELRSVAYISSTHGTLSEQTLEHLLLDARAFNQSLGVTGVLLYNSAAFFQYFEGDAAACETVLQRVQRSSQHHSVQVLVDQALPARVFSDWTMAFSQASESQVLALGQAQWQALAADCGTPSLSESSGIAMLKAFWQAATLSD